jgi:hypothetical protein
MKTKKKADPVVTCGCGRSPTGQCMGWHGLEEDEFRQQLAEYDVEQNRIANEQLIKTKGI